MPKHPLLTLKSSTVFQTRWFKLEEDQVQKIGDGTDFTYTYLSVAPSVMVVAIDSDGRIVIVRQYRYPTRRYSYELPGGGSGGEPPKKAALRELQEETGFRAASIEKLGEFVTYCGLADEICHVLLATDLTPGRQELDKSEDISVHAVAYPELLGMISSGEFCYGMGLAALHLARARLDLAAVR
jgi:8-oxo-dGTP pyrophosphatase MutT (NUDIX family)